MQSSIFTITGGSPFGMPVLPFRGAVPMNHVRQLTIALGLAAGILGLLGIVWLCFGPVYPATLVSCVGNPDPPHAFNCMASTSWSGLIKWEGGSLAPPTLLYLSLLALAWTGVIVVSVFLCRAGTWRWRLALWSMIGLLAALNLFGPPRTTFFLLPGLTFALLASLASLVSGQRAT